MCNISFFAQCEDCIILHCNKYKKKKPKILTRVDFKSNNLCVIEVQAVSINLVSLKKIYCIHCLVITPIFIQSFPFSEVQRFLG